MPSSEPPESSLNAGQESISTHADDWIGDLVKQFEFNLIDASSRLGSDAGILEYRVAAVRAVFEALRFSGTGADDDCIAELMGQVWVERRLGSVAWTPALNQRRFELIDKEIQETLTPVEQLELAGLTGMMRQQLDSEENLPLEGAKALHRKLLELK